MDIATRLAHEQSSLGKKILELEKSNQLTQKKLAEITGINQRIIRRLEKGETNLEFKTLLRLTIAFKTEIANLFDYKNQLEKRTIVKNQQDFTSRLSKEKQNLGNRISKLCKHRGIDQEELGILSKIASSDISLYINGEENLVLLTLLKIAIGLEVEIVDLFNYDGKMPDNNTFEGKLQF
jgi:transcriptional regulator with XRE-family HTH domain